MKYLIYCLTLCLSMLYVPTALSQDLSPEVQEIVDEYNETIDRITKQNSFEAYTDKPMHIGFILGHEGGLLFGMEVRNIVSPVGVFFTYSGTPEYVPSNKGRRLYFAGETVVSKEEEVFSESSMASTFGLTFDLLYSNPEHRNKLHLYVAGSLVESLKVTRAYTLYRSGLGTTYDITRYLARRDSKVTGSFLMSYTAYSSRTSCYLSIIAGKNLGVEGPTIASSFGMMF